MRVDDLSLFVKLPVDLGEHTRQRIAAPVEHDKLTARPPEAEVPRPLEIADASRAVARHLAASCRFAAVGVAQAFLDSLDAAELIATLGDAHPTFERRVVELGLGSPEGNERRPERGPLHAEHRGQALDFRQLDRERAA